MNLNEIQKQSELLKKYRDEFVTNLVNNYCANKNIINFIADIRFHSGNGVAIEDSIETIRCLFEAGFCYDFAKILERIYPGGEVCYCYDFGHIVYVYEGIAYDISGVTDVEYEMFIPLSAMGKLAFDFEHRPDLAYNATREEVIKLGETCRIKHQYINAITQNNFGKEIVQRTKDVLKECSVLTKDKKDFEDMEHFFILTLEKGIINQNEFEHNMDEYCWKNKLSWQLIKRLRKGEC